MKILLMNYQPYEYQLLQDKLDTLTQSGYYPKSMGFITFFHKEESDERLVVDVFKSSSRDYEQKMRDQQAFLDPYIDASYNVLYTNKNGLYIFNGSHQPPTKYLNKHNTNLKKGSYKYLFYFVLCLIALLVFSFVLSDGLSFTSMTSYGSCLMPIGIVGFLFSFVYYFYDVFLKTFRFDRNKNEKISLKDKINHIVHHVLISICVIFVIGCLVEDFTNTKNISTSDHDVYTLNSDSSYTYTVNHGLLSTSYYNYKEYDNDDYVLNVKEYDFENSSNYYDEIISSPSLIGCDEIKSYETYDIGIYNGEKNIVMIHDENKIIIINVMKDISDNQINEILEFYN